MVKKIKSRRMLNIILSIVLLFFVGITTISQATPEKEDSNGLLDKDAGKPIFLEKVNRDKQGSAISREIDTADTLVSENDNFSLYLDEKRLIVKVLDKGNGYVWASGIDTDDVEELTGEWKNFSQSILVVEYLDKYAPTKLVRSYPVPQDIEFMENGFTAKVLFEKPEITVKVSVILEDDGITVEIPDESIIYEKDTDGVNFTLSKLYVMPFFGAVQGGEADGYLFIPDGCGGLIRFTDTKKYSVAYSSRVYGDDYGIKKEIDINNKVPAVKNQNVHIPVFGISHGYNDNAFVAIIENGAEYTDIEGYPAGVKVDYFWSTAKFNYIESYYQPTGSGSGFSHLPKEANTVNAKVSYKFLRDEDAGYVGMAKKYRESLLEKGALAEQARNKEDIPLLLEAFMAEEQKGLFINSVKTMTTISDVERWVDELQESSVNNLLLSLKGYQKGGVSGSDLGSYRVERKVGGEKDLKALYEQLGKQDNKLLLTMDFSRVYEHQTRNANFVFNIDRSPAQVFQKKLLYSKLRFINSKTIDKLFKDMDELPEYKNNILMESTGNTLLSDHRLHKEETRSEVLEKTIKSLEQAYNNLDTLILDSPNEYAFQYAHYISNMPSSHSRYIYESDSVPFLQIVLSGYVDYFGPHINFGTQQIDDVLKLIDYNMYPSYVITERESAEFEDTNVNDIYFSQYKVLKPYIIENYKLVNEILSQVYGQSIVDRDVVEDGISVTSYEDNTRIVVNYTDNRFSYEGTMVESKSAIVIRGDEK